MSSKLLRVSSKSIIDETLSPIGRENDTLNINTGFYANPDESLRAQSQLRLSFSDSPRESKRLARIERFCTTPKQADKPARLFTESEHKRAEKIARSSDGK